MLTRISLILLVMFFILPMVLAQPEEAVQVSEEITQNFFETKNYPGMAIAVAKGHEWIWTEAYGYANIADSIVVDPNRSLFRIGSVSKTLTAAGLMQLYQQGTINLDEDIQKYVSKFPKKQYPVSVRQIAQHVGGIRHYEGDEFLSQKHYKTVTDGLVIFASDSLIYEPGTKYSYSSYGWNLISAAMETASSQEFLMYMKNHVFAPAGMKSTFPDDATSKMTNRVTFYEEGKNISPSVDNSFKWAGGGFLSTAADLVRFSQAILDNTRMSVKTLDAALQTYTLVNGKSTTRGIGFEVDEDKKGRTWIGHGGGSIGGTTMLIIYPDQELIVVVLVNQSDASVRNSAFSIAEQFLNK